MNHRKPHSACGAAAALLVLLAACDQGAVMPVPPRILSVTLTAEPTSGEAPLVVDVTAAVSDASGAMIDYSFDCASDGAFEATVATAANPYTAAGVCTYADTGTFVVKTTVSTDGATGEATTSVRVTAPLPPAQDSIVVLMQDNVFSARDITVKPGTKIIWRNVGQAPHTSTSDDAIWDSGIVNAGGSFAWVVPADAAAGTVYAYYCDLHGAAGGIGMAGTIEVQPDAQPPPPPPAVSDSVIVLMKDDFFSAKDLTVKPGTKIIWRNDGLRAHTSTSDSGVWESGNVDPGNSWSWIVPADAADGTTYPYHCFYHGDVSGVGMAGTIVVQLTAPPPPPPAVTDSIIVLMQDNVFVERDITVKPGTKVIWRNAGQRPHTATEDNGVFDSGTVNEGGSWSWIVPADAVDGTTYLYYCVFHGDVGGVGMAGTIVVQLTAPPPPPPPPQPSATVTTPGNTFSPERVEIPVGGRVTWEFSGATHNVTFTDVAPPGGDIPDSAPGTTASRDFPAAGDYDYECTLHAGQTGRVRVR